MKQCYTPHPEGLGRDALPDGHGACDAMLMGSIIYPEDGSLSTCWFSADGRSKNEEGNPAELDADEWFKLWTILASAVAERLENGARKDLCELVVETVREAVMELRFKEMTSKSTGAEVIYGEDVEAKDGPRRVEFAVDVGLLSPVAKTALQRGGTLKVWNGALELRVT